MSRLKIELLAVLMGIGTASGAQAGGSGTKTPMVDVSIQTDPAIPTQSIANGAIGVARSHSIDGTAQTKEIGCQVTVYGPAGGTQPPGASVTCTAKKDTVQLSCYSDDANLVAVAEGINGDSQVTFEVVPGVGKAVNECLSIFVENNSHHLPKAP